MIKIKTDGIFYYDKGEIRHTNYGFTNICIRDEDDRYNVYLYGVKYSSCKTIDDAWEKYHLVGKIWLKTEWVDGFNCPRIISGPYYFKWMGRTFTIVDDQMRVEHDKFVSFVPHYGNPKLAFDMYMKAFLEEWFDEV